MTTLLKEIVTIIIHNKENEEYTNQDNQINKDYFKNTLGFSDSDLDEVF